MKKCPYCGKAYPDHALVCSTDGQPLEAVKSSPPVSPSPSAVEKIAVLDNEVQAELVDSVLSERNIPHLMRSYYDSAMNGIYQSRAGWGHVEAPQSFRDEILAIIQDLKRQASSGTAPQNPEAGS